jgi:hypothetical protein
VFVVCCVAIGRSVVCLRGACSNSNRLDHVGRKEAQGEEACISIMPIRHALLEHGAEEASCARSSADRKSENHTQTANPTTQCTHILACPFEAGNRTHFVYIPKTAPSLLPLNALLAGRGAGEGKREE